MLWVIQFRGGRHGFETFTSKLPLEPKHAVSCGRKAACFSTKVKKYPRCSISSLELPRSTTWPSLRHIISSLGLEGRISSMKHAYSGTFKVLLACRHFDLTNWSKSIGKARTIMDDQLYNCLANTYDQCITLGDSYLKHQFGPSSACRTVESLCAITCRVQRSCATSKHSSNLAPEIGQTAEDMTITLLPLVATRRSRAF